MSGIFDVNGTVLTTVRLCREWCGKIPHIMPNAETHLTAACDLLAEPALMQAFPWLADDACRAAFVMGSISPDVRAIGGQTREQTHFFTIPFDDERPAPQVMCADWPQLAAVGHLANPHAAFVAGYMTHLIMDQVWVERVVMPGLYINGVPWGLDHPNWRRYCILMAYEEYRAGDRLPEGTTNRLVSAHPGGWLPFVADADLSAWCARVAKLIDEGGPGRVSSLLTESCKLSIEVMESIVRSEDRMAEEVYMAVSRDRLMGFEAETARRSRETVHAYLSGQLVS